MLSLKHALQQAFRRHRRQLPPRPHLGPCRARNRTSDKLTHRYGPCWAPGRPQRRTATRPQKISAGFSHRMSRNSAATPHPDNCCNKAHRAPQHWRSGAIPYDGLALAFGTPGRELTIPCSCYSLPPCDTRRAHAYRGEIKDSGHVQHVKERYITKPTGRWPDHCIHIFLNG